MTTAPTGPQPYVPLIFDDLGATPDALIVPSQLRLAANVNGWTPSNGSLSAALLGIAMVAAADLRAMVTDTAAGFLAGVGALLQLDRIRAVPAIAATTWTFTGTSGHLVPAGTPVSSPTGTYGDFLLTADLIVPVGTTTAAGVTVVAAIPGTAGNGLPVGQLILGESLLDVSTVAVTSASAGGVDPETDDAYRARVADRLRLLSAVPVLPLDYSRLATDIGGVARVLTVKGWDATTGSTGVEACVTVVPLDATGHPVTGTVQGQVAVHLNALRGANTLVRVASPAYTRVAVTVTVVGAPGADPVALQVAVTATIGAFLDPLAWSLGLTAPPTWLGDPLLRPLDLAARINDLAGVAHVTSLDVNGGGTAVVDLSAGLPATSRYAVLPAPLYTDPAWTASTAAVTVTT